MRHVHIRLHPQICCRDFLPPQTEELSFKSPQTNDHFLIWLQNSYEEILNVNWIHADTFLLLKTGCVLLDKSLLLIWCGLDWCPWLGSRELHQQLFEETLSGTACPFLPLVLVYNKRIQKSHLEEVFLKSLQWQHQHRWALYVKPVLENKVKISISMQ